MRRRAWCVLVAVLVLALGVAVPLASAQAPQPPASQVQAQPGQGPTAGLFLVGQLTRLQGSTLTVTTPDGAWTVTTDSETILRLGPKIQDVADLPLEEPIMVKGQVLESGTLHALTISRPIVAKQAVAKESLRQLQQARRLSGSVRGEIASVTANEIVITCGEENQTVPLGADTRFRVPEVEEGTWQDLEAGQLAVVLPGPEGEQARAVSVVTSQQMRRINAQQQRYRRVRQVVAPRGLRGTVTAISGTSLTIETPAGERTIHTDAKTRFFEGRQGKAEMGDIAVGDMIVVQGQPDPSCSIEAKAVILVPEQPEDTP